MDALFLVKEAHSNSLCFELSLLVPSRQSAGPASGHHDDC